MKASARGAYLFILLFLIFFNGLQAYLIVERISDSKDRFRFTSSGALMTALSEYHKMKVVDSLSMPSHAWISYSKKPIEVNRPDTHSVNLSTPFSTLVTDTVHPAVIEMVVNSPAFRSIDLKLFDSLLKKALHSKQVNSEYRIDTIIARGRKADRQHIPAMSERKKRQEYSYATSPMRLPFFSSIFIFAQFKNDPAFFRKDLMWPMIAFVFIILIGNAALVFVYRTISKQKRINEVKTDFINNITHEMNTPITIAQAGIEALEHHVPANERTEFYLQTSKKQLLLLNEFVDRILDAAVQDFSDFVLKKEEIDVNALFHELIAGYSILQGKPANFRISGDGPVIINGDRLHLKTAFHNIIDNAIKYSNESVEINIDFVENSRDCSITIRDNGMGIPTRFIKNIFEKFFRVPQGDAQSVKGFGLGLYYVNSIVKKHSGSISVNSKLQSGTEFIIVLPKQS